MICVKDAAMDVVHLSPEWHGFTGIDSVRALGRGWIDAVHADDRGVVHAILDQAGRERRGYTLEYRLLSRTGAGIWVSDGAVASFAPEDRHFLGLMGSITEMPNDRGRSMATGLIGAFKPPPPMPSTITARRQDLMADYLLLARSLADPDGDRAVIETVDFALYLTRKRLVRSIH